MYRLTRYFERILNTIVRSKYDTPNDWLLASLPFFRSISFFNEYTDLSGIELAEKLENLQINEFGSSFDFTDEICDLLLLRWDRSRVWWEDLEADVCKENKVYTRILEEWANISRSSFNPLHIKENWISKKGLIEVSLEI